MQASMDSETVRERLEDLGEELNTVASLVHLSIKNQQQEGVDEAAGAFDCSGDAERKFQVHRLLYNANVLLVVLGFLGVMLALPGKVVCNCNGRLAFASERSGERSRSVVYSPAVCLCSCAQGRRTKSSVRWSFDCSSNTNMFEFPYSPQHRDIALAILRSMG